MIKSKKNSLFKFVIHLYKTQYKKEEKLQSANGKIKKKKKNFVGKEAQKKTAIKTIFCCCFNLFL